MDGATTSEVDDPSLESAFRWSEVDPELWKRLRLDGDAEARERIVGHYLGFARRIARRLFVRRIIREAEFGDYHQYALTGLLEAVGRYDPERGVPFTAYAIRRIEGAIQNGIAKASEAHEQLAYRHRYRKERVESLRAEETPESEEGLFGEMVDVAIGLALGYLLEDTGIMAADSESVLEAPTDPYRLHLVEQQKQVARNLVDRLAMRERQIIRYHYFDGVEFTELAAMFGVTKGRISQLHKQALERLLRWMQENHNLDRSI